MSQLLSRLSNLSPRSNSLIRLFSSSSTNPYLTLGCAMKDLPGGGNIGDVLLFLEDMLTVPEKIIPQKLLVEEVLGSSRGWGFSCIYTLAKPKLSQMWQFPLLHLIKKKTKIGLLLSSSWLDSLVYVGLVVSFLVLISLLLLTKKTLNLMYPKIDQIFYLPTPGGHQLFSYDLNFKQDNNPKIQELQFRDLPELPQSQWQLLDSCRMQDGVSGRVGLHWYGQGSRTERFMVFREAETMEGIRNMCYTEDIEDVCNFLSETEASSCPGLQPNSIYYLGHGFGIYDLTTRTSRTFQPPKGAGAPPSLSAPYWLSPFSI